MELDAADMFKVFAVKWLIIHLLLLLRLGDTSYQESGRLKAEL